MTRTATYTAQEVEMTVLVLKENIQNFTVWQRKKLGTVDYPALATEILDFFAKADHDFTSEETLFAGVSPQFLVLRQMGLVTIELS
jgi:hypothetical protein